MIRYFMRTEAILYKYAAIADNIAFYRLRAYPQQLSSKISLLFHFHHRPSTTTLFARRGRAKAQDRSRSLISSMKYVLTLA